MPKKLPSLTRQLVISHVNEHILTWDSDVKIKNNSGAFFHLVYVRPLHVMKNVEEMYHRLHFVSPILDYLCTALQTLHNVVPPQIVPQVTAVTLASLATRIDHNFALGEYIP